MSSPPDRAGVQALEHSLSWRVLVDEPLTGAANMARDHALASGLRPGNGTLRFYRWTPATLSLGRNEPFTVGYRKFLRERTDVDVVRRPTGGRAVLHDRELTYAVVLPIRAFGGPRRSYRRINVALVEGLRRLGADARVAEGRALPPDAGPCFLEPADGEVVVAGRKVVGSAQVRIGNAVLQHGSLLLFANQSPLLARAALAGAGTSAPGTNVPHGISGDDSWRAAVQRRQAGACGGLVDAAPDPARPITLSEVLGEVPAWPRLVEALAAGFAQTLGGDWSRSRMREHEEALVASYEPRYASRAWTWRR